MNTNGRLIASEENYKELVYRTFEMELLNASENVRKKKENVDSGAYEAQDSFMIHGGRYFSAILFSDLL